MGTWLLKIYAFNNRLATFNSSKKGTAGLNKDGKGNIYFPDLKGNSVKCLDFETYTLTVFLAVLGRISGEISVAKMSSIVSLLLIR